jgi:citronellol/citronellal dehydrogenase
MPEEPAEASRLLRSGLLDGQVVVVATPAPEGGLVAGVVAACAGLSAHVEELTWSPDDQEACERSLASVLNRHTRLHTLVNDAGGAYQSSLDAGAEPGVGYRALRAALDGAWNATRAAANAAFIPAEGGKVINLAPAPGTGPGAASTAAGLENMARTLSIEWARYGICITTIAPTDAATPAQVASLVAFLASPAGDYYSGCRFDLGRDR